MLAIKCCGNFGIFQVGLAICCQKKLQKAQQTPFYIMSAMALACPGLILDLWCDCHTQSSALSFEKNFSVEMVKNDIRLGGASKQNALFSENMP